MNFKEFRNALQKHCGEMAVGVTNLFRVEVDKEELWNLYLDSFPSNTNSLYRKRREFDCSCCRSFVKEFGSVVTIVNGVVTSIWDLTLGDDKYQVVADAMAKFIHSKPIAGLYLSRSKGIGTEHNFEISEDGTEYRWDHFYFEIPKKFVNTGSLGSEYGSFRDTRNVFKRSLDELTEESVSTVLELIAQGSLYRGEEWKGVLQKFSEYQHVYSSLDSERAKELYSWEKSSQVGDVIGRIRNHSIGVLLAEISAGIALDIAVSKYEKVVAPENYKRPKSIYTKQMLEDAKKTVTELGYLDSLPRRFATLDDISVNNILFSNKDAVKRIAGGADLFGELEKEVSISPKKFSKVEEISVSDFVEKVLPTTQEVEAFIERKHIPNFVSLIAPVNKEAPSMFKWDNPFSWAYSVNVTDSLKQHVKEAGGSIDGVLRFSIQWNDNDGRDDSDLDAYCIEPNGDEIYFGTFRKPKVSRLGGQLDVDVIHPGTNIAVENITWQSKKGMIIGVYKFFVHQYTARNSQGFCAEIEFDGQIYSFDYPKGLRTGEKVPVAEVTLHEDGSFSLKDVLPKTVSSKEVWGVHTDQFIPVSVICYSPNYWDEQTGNGNRHFFFMLKDCVNPDQSNGFYNKFLKQELLTHKRVFEALGSKASVESVDDQLSGLGFSSTVRNELVCRVKGKTDRVLRVKF